MVTPIAFKGRNGRVHVPGSVSGSRVHEDLFVYGDFLVYQSAWSAWLGSSGAPKSAAHGPKLGSDATPWTSRDKAAPVHLPTLAVGSKAAWGIDSVRRTPADGSRGIASRSIYYRRDAD